jgi:hypothetical protein
MAMPWSRAKQIARALRGEDTFPDGYKGSRTIEELRRLFDACFRIAHEAGVPLVVENVKGAEPWVGYAPAHYGSFYLFGDVNSVGGSIVGAVPRFGEGLRPARRGQKHNPDGTEHGQGSWIAIADSKNRGAGQKVSGFRFDGSGRSFQSAAVAEMHADRDSEGVKQHGSGAEWWRTGNGALPSSSPRRKAASAQIAKIPFPLASHIARIFKAQSGS